MQSAIADGVLEPGKAGTMGLQAEQYLSTMVYLFNLTNCVQLGSLFCANSVGKSPAALQWGVELSMVSYRLCHISLLPHASPFQAIGLVAHLAAMLWSLLLAQRRQRLRSGSLSFERVADVRQSLSCTAHADFI